jgi:hypothetical protein
LVDIRVAVVAGRHPTISRFIFDYASSLFVICAHAHRLSGLLTLFRFHRSFRAFCLGVIGFTNPPIGKALVAGGCKKLFSALGIGNLECRAAIVKEIEFRQVVVKMGFAAMLIDADHSALEDREHAFDRVGVNDPMILEIFSYRCLRKWITNIVKISRIEHCVRPGSRVGEPIRVEITTELFCQPTIEHRCRLKLCVVDFQRALDNIGNASILLFCKTVSNLPRP